ncbi:hypothetical protein COCOBI_19-1910 [Coccomyxa sp. Obi]|nr:hypothetical protein COCOBI_19-1910 [Coccomyxa sp. Obi]
MARASHRSLVVPSLLLNGEQLSAGTHLSGNNASSVPFEDIYDMKTFKEKLESLGVKVVAASRAPPFPNLTVASPDDLAKASPSLHSYQAVKHLQIQCPLWAIPGDQMLQEADTIKVVLAGLQPSQDLLKYVDAASEHLKGLSADGTFNFLHLRLENDWVAHCKRWTDIRDGKLRNNCFNNTFSLATQLVSKGVLPGTPLFVSMYWPSTDERVLEQALGSLLYEGYNLVLKPDALDFLYSLPREVAASVSYFLSMRSERFIGNSVSTFSALSILERRIEGKWASYYNGGNIPLAVYIPLYALPWVFTFNSWSQEYEYMLKPAVISASSHKSLHPVCVFSGDTKSLIFRWLTRQGVQTIVQNSAWAGLLEKSLNNSGDNVHHSHLYANNTMALGFLERIDVPLLPQLSEYEYVLFTDSDIFFRKPLTLESFQLPLPTTIGMAPEGSDGFPFDAGVMLLNIPALKSSYPAFARFVFSNEHGMFFPRNGPGDQGAYDQFNESTVHEGKLLTAFNAKPYHPFDDDATIVHWHGPKPMQFIRFLQSGRCPLKQGDNMCSRGLENSYCQYLREWTVYAEPQLSADFRAALSKCPNTAAAP